MSIIFQKNYEERFWNNVNISDKDSCWDWKAGRSGTGYGCCYCGSSERKAHRVSWIYTNGPIPKDKLVLHKCDNRLCVNPNHLYLGSRSDNQRDRADSNSIKFTKDMIESMKRMYYEYGLKQKEIARIFKTDQSVISRAINYNPRVGG